MPLLALLVLLFPAYPYLEEGLLATAVLNLLVSAILVMALRAIMRQVAAFRLALVIGIPTLVATWVDVFIDSRALTIGLAAAFAIFYGATAWSLAVSVVRSASVTTASLAGAACAYIMVGLAWASTYTMVEGLAPQSFTAAYKDAGTAVDWSDLFYFSFSTLTSVGYGDITPRTSMTRSLAMLEAVSGVFFIAVLIGRLVNLHRSQRDDT